MEGIPLEDAVPDVPLEHLGAVLDPHHFDRGEPRANCLAPPRVARHEVRLDKPGENLEICLDISPINGDGRAPRGAAQVRVAFQVAPHVAFDAVRRRHVGAEHLAELLLRRGAVQTRGDEKEHLVPGNTGPGKGVEDGREELAVGNRPCSVGDDDAGVTTPARDLGQRSGADRARQCLRHGGGRVPHRRVGRERDHPGEVPIGHLDGNPSPSVVKVDPHGATSGFDPDGNIAETARGCEVRISAHRELSRRGTSSGRRRERRGFPRSRS